MSINDASVDIDIHAEEEDELNASLEKVTSWLHHKVTNLLSKLIDMLSCYFLSLITL